MTILTTAALFYLHLAGQSVDPAIISGVYALWLALAAWLTIRRPRSMLVIAALILVALALSVSVPWGLRRLLTILGYVITYQALTICRLPLTSALSHAAILMAGLAITGIHLGNPNVVIGFIYLAGMAGLGLVGWQRWLTLGMSAAALLAIGCRGAWLAVAVAGIVYARQYLALAVVPLGSVAAIWLRPSSVADRLQVWAAALGDLSLFGRGLGSAAIYPSLQGGLFYHTHCLPLTVALEAGLPGLAALGYGAWRLLPRLARGWPGAALAGLLAWSLVDEVIWFWGCGMIAIWLLAEVMRESA